MALEVSLSREMRLIDVTMIGVGAMIGAAFDFRRYLKMDEERLFDVHGRGVLLASAALEL